VIGDGTDSRVDIAADDWGAERLGEHETISVAAMIGWYVKTTLSEIQRDILRRVT
jgi:hypothetical protein